MFQFAETLLACLVHVVIHVARVLILVERVAYLLEVTPISVQCPGIQRSGQHVCEFHFVTEPLHRFLHLHAFIFHHLQGGFVYPQLLLGQHLIGAPSQSVEEVVGQGTGIEQRLADVHDVYKLGEGRPCSQCRPAVADERRHKSHHHLRCTYHAEGDVIVRPLAGCTDFTYHTSCRSTVGTAYLPEIAAIVHYGVVAGLPHNAAYGVSVDIHLFQILAGIEVAPIGLAHDTACCTHIAAYIALVHGIVEHGNGGVTRNAAQMSLGIVGRNDTGIINRMAAELRLAHNASYGSQPAYIARVVAALDRDIVKYQSVLSILTDARAAYDAAHARMTLYPGLVAAGHDDGRARASRDTSGTKATRVAGMPDFTVVGGSPHFTLVGAAHHQQRVYRARNASGTGILGRDGSVIGTSLQYRSRCLSAAS